MHLYPNNTLQNYKTEVSLTGEFLGEWEVGMASISYPAMWYNIGEGDTRCYVFMADNTVRACDLQIGRYRSLDGILGVLNKALNSTIRGALRFFSLYYDDLTRKVVYRMGKRNESEYVNHPEVIGTTFSKNITSILGFHDFWDREVYPEDAHPQNKLDPTSPEQSFRGKYVADLNRGIHNMYVYVQNTYKYSLQQ